MTYQWQFEIGRTVQETSRYSETRSAHMRVHMRVNTAPAQPTRAPQVLSKLIRHEHTLQLTGGEDEQ
jgi:hypothetical protein